MSVQSGEGGDLEKDLSRQLSLRSGSLTPWRSACIVPSPMMCRQC